MTARTWAAWLAQWAALAALYYVAIHLALRGRARAGDGIAVLAAVLGAASFRLAAGAFAAASRAAEERRVLARSLAGAPPQDGKRYAAAGRITPLAAPLAAPFSGAACVAYRYWIRERTSPMAGAELASARVRPARQAGEALRTGAEASSVPITGWGAAATGSRPAFAGLALAPAAIATGGPAGEVRLLGFPCLEGFPATALDDDAARARAVAYVAVASFQEIGAADLETLPGQPLPLAALAADAEAPLRRDWRVAGRQEVRPDDQLAETVVAAGEEVCALGLFHAAEGGVAPDPSPEGRPLRLLRGDAAAVAAALAREGRGRADLALILLLVPHALLAALLLWR